MVVWLAKTNVFLDPAFARSETRIDVRCPCSKCRNINFLDSVKLNPPADVKIDTLLLNGAECEPYLNSDNRLMLEHPESIING